MSESRTTAGLTSRPRLEPAEHALFTVTELAQELGVTPRAIRFYEDKGLITPRRLGTTRVYAPRDRARMILILRGKRLGFSLSDIGEYLNLYDADLTGRAQLTRLIEALDARRATLAAQRQAVNEALGELDEIMRLAQHALAAAGRQKPSE